MMPEVNQQQANSTEPKLIQKSVKPSHLFLILLDFGKNWSKKWMNAPQREELILDTWNQSTRDLGILKE